MADQNIRTLALIRDDLPENQWPILSCSGAKEVQADGNIKTTNINATGTIKATTFQGDGSNLSGVVKNLDSVVKKAGDTVTGPLTIQNNLNVTGEAVIGGVKWGNNSRLQADQGGSIELGGDGNTPGSGTPYIDFHFAGLTQDFNTRIINDANGRLSLQAAEVALVGDGMKWGNNSRLQADQGGSIELGGDRNTPGSGTPYIDFHFAGLTQDFNTRIINDANGQLTLEANRVVGRFVQPSSRELKENIAILSPQEATRTLAELQPVTFQYKSDSDKRENIGFIAEDVPEAIATLDRQGLSIMNIVGVLTKVVQEQQTTIANLTEQVKALESRLEKSLVNRENH